MADILAEICAKKAEHVAHSKSRVSLDDIKARLQDVDAPRGFLEALKLNAPNSIIAEIKKASPSGGVIRENFDPAEIAKSYEMASATCLSVLTDVPYFQGHDDYLKQARDVCALPCLRKDFMIDAYQIYESRALGADCVLLIVAALERAQLQDMHDLANDLGMDVLVEVHNQEELDIALLINPALVGVNNRNLKTLNVSLQTSVDLSENIPDNVFKISESGIKTAEDITMLQSHGYQGFLIGESLMQSPDVAYALESLRG